MKVVYTSVAASDVLDAIEYLVERDPVAAAALDSELQRIVDLLANGAMDGPRSILRSGELVHSWPVPPFRVFYRRENDVLLIVRVYHGAREPLAE